MKLTFILLAAGSSLRFKNTEKSIEKQFKIINGKTVLEICIENFIKLKLNSNFLLVVSKSKILQSSKICSKYNLPLPISGGKNRQDSVKIALKFLNSTKTKYVMIHDVARPFISKNVVIDLIQNMKHCSCVVPSLKVSDALIHYKNNNVHNYLNKNEYRLLQTPQICNYLNLYNSHIKNNDKKIFDDESSLLLEYNHKIKIISGDPKSLKITYKKDFVLFKNILQKTSMKKYITKVGLGYDVHKMVKKTSNTSSKKLMLGGLEIENGYYLKGHSDADVLLHSITDSIYGAMNDHDIGFYFPPEDNKWKNTNSFIFLNHALRKLKEKKGRLVHIDAVVITQTPKILDYVKKIKNKISLHSSIQSHQLSIKGKSNEEIGFIGRKEGIAVISNTTIKILDE